MEHVCIVAKLNICCSTFCRNIAGVMALYRKPLNFIIVPAARRHLLSVMIPLLKENGGLLIITGVSPGMEMTVMSMLPESWNGVVFGQDAADGTLTVGCITANRPFHIVVSLTILQNRALEMLHSVMRDTGLVWKTVSKAPRPGSRKLRSLGM